MTAVTEHMIMTEDHHHMASTSIKVAELFTIICLNQLSSVPAFLAQASYQQSGVQREIWSERFIRFCVACTQIDLPYNRVEVEYDMHSSVRQLPEKLSEDDKGP